MRILRSISFSLTIVLYTLIPKLYAIFEILATNKFFTEKNIANISNNIYILVSVIMLFAFGIKLISTIVNPDLVEDKKKGTGKTFVNAIIAVVLITLIPFGFTKLYEAQGSLLESHFVEKVVFGMDPEGGNEPGQVLAGYTFSAFCHPASDKVVSTEMASSGENHYNNAITKDINEIEYLDGIINNKIGDEWEMEYNIILSPLAGGYVVYELILMCIDIAFRSIKLGLLQLIAPLVICAFIFSGQDLLVRWIKEVVSTFVLVFIKIAALTFMIYGLSLLPNFLTQDDVKDKYGLIGGSNLAQGFIRVVILIALLQLVKKLPDIINKIFGTDIKMSGGIGDRLGEMAGIGNLAKGAWDKLKTTTGRIAGKAGKIAGAGIGMAAFPWTIPFAAGAGAGLYGWRRGFRGGQPWKNTVPGRRLRTFGAGAQGVWKGLTSDGGIIKGIKEGTQSYRDSDIAALRRSTRNDEIISDVKNSFGIGEDGRITDVRKLIQANNKPGATIEALKRIQTAADNIQASMDKQHIHGDITIMVQDLAKASRDKEIADTIKGKYDSINSKLQSYIDSETDAVKQAELRKIQGDFLRGAMKATDVTSKVGTLLGAGAEGSLKADSDKLSHLLKTTNEDGKTFENVFTLNGTTQGISIGTLGDEVNAIKNTFDARKADVDSAKDNYKLNDYQKTAVDRTVSSIETTSKTYAATQANYYVDDTTVNQNTPIPPNPGGQNP